MNIKSGFMLRKVVDIYVILGIGSEAYAPRQIMSVNETGAFLWKLLETGTDREALVEALLSEFEVDRAVAEKDVDAFLAKLQEKALIDE